MPAYTRQAHRVASALLLLCGLATVSRAQPGSAPPTTPPPPTAPAAVEGDGAKIDRSGAYVDQRVGLGTFNVLDRGDGLDDISRFAVGLANEIGVHLGPFVSLFFDTSVVFHHYETAGDVAEWVYDDVGKWGFFDVFRVFFGTLAIPLAMFVDSHTNLSLGLRFHPMASSKSPYFEVGGGLSLLLDRPDGVYGGVYGAMGGIGYQLSHRYSVGARVYWSPVFENDNARSGAPGVSALLVFQLR